MLPRTPQGVEVAQFDHRFHSCDNCNRSYPSSDLAELQVEAMGKGLESSDKIQVSQSVMSHVNLKSCWCFVEFVDYLVI